MALLARYRADGTAKIAHDPIYFDQRQQLRFDQIVGWSAWFGNGARHSSLDTNYEHIPRTDAQFVMVYHFNDGRGKRIYRHGYSGLDIYALPNTDILIEGAWTTQQGLDAIDDRAWAEPWPPTWV